MRIQAILATILLAGASAQAQSPPSEAALDAAREQDPVGEAFASARADLTEATDALSRLRGRIAEEKLPLAKRLRALEERLLDARAEYQQAARELDERTLGIATLKSKADAQEEEVAYIENLLGEFVDNFETRLHIAERRSFEEPIAQFRRLRAEASDSSAQDVRSLAGFLDRSLDHLEEAAGGADFEGTAVGPSGRVLDGRFRAFGPVVLFASESGDVVGTVEEHLGSLEPAVVPFSAQEDAEATRAVVRSGTGEIPVDPTLGSAHKIEATEETVLEQVDRGGPVMIPIVGLALLAAAVALFKWVAISRVPTVGPRRLRRLFEAIEAREEESVSSLAGELKGPMGTMIRAGLGHRDQPTELVDEVMYEQIIGTRQRLNRLLPFLSVTAAAAPLLGLLGTVTGIINTFKLITVFGSGDVKALSGGISEALITTKYGLVVAIPALLVHAYLSRKAKGITDAMNKASVALVNHLKSAGHLRSQQGGDNGAVVHGDEIREETIRAHVNAVVAEILAPLTRDMPLSPEAVRDRGDN